MSQNIFLGFNKTNTNISQNVTFNGNTVNEIKLNNTTIWKPYWHTVWVGDQVISTSGSSYSTKKFPNIGISSDMWNYTNSNIVPIRVSGKSYDGGTAFNEVLLTNLTSTAGTEVCFDSYSQYIIHPYVSSGWLSGKVRGPGLGPAKGIRLLKIEEYYSD